jgi:6-phosphogluconolactonase (cycloisomerase 2 family)
MALLAGGLLAPPILASADGGDAGAVYTLSNASAGNQVLVFHRAVNGSLTAAGSFATGGLGTGAGLGSEGALLVTGRWIIAVNAGSNDVSVLAREDGHVVSRVGSGGSVPVSVTAAHDLVYVVNAGSSNIQGYRLGEHGQLSPIADSNRPLSGAGVGPAEISFSPEGETLVVTEKSTSLIDTYRLGAHGAAQGPVTHPSSGSTPFGFAFGEHNTLIVSEAAASAASSYHVDEHGGLQLVTGSLINGQLAACWVATARQFAYTADAHNGMISSYGVGHNGALTLLQSAAAAPGGAPLDEAVSGIGQFLYVLNPSTGVINAFSIHHDGSLGALANTAGIPASASGLVAQ